MIGATVALAACGGPTDPPFPRRAVPLSVPAQYTLWWQTVESCAVLDGDLGAVNWYMLPGVNSFSVGGRALHGYWWGDGNRIVLAEGAVSAGRLVRHEMLHALLQSGAHGREHFADRCGGIVACDDQCADDIGEPPQIPQSADVVAPPELDLSVTVSPDAPSQSANDGWFLITVTVRNPRASPAWVALEPVAPGQPNSATFGYVADDLFEYLWTPEPRLPFRAGEVRRFAFDINSRGNSGWTARSYSFRAFFNSDSTPPETLVVGP